MAARAPKLQTVDPAIRESLEFMPVISTVEAKRVVKDIEKAFGRKLKLAPTKK